MKQYTSIEELFEDNKELFDTDKKKAWFLIGNVYSRVMYQSKKYYEEKKANVNGESKNPVSYDVSYLENGFIFKNFDYGTFMDFATKCTELLIKYGVYSRAGYLKADISQAILLMDGQNTKTSTSEAKYMFVAGLNQFIKHKKKEDNKGDIEFEDEKHRK
ncbi:MAG: CRISPR-associated protein Csh1 [Euryarchaeota archaeon]|nr:CRISPR-associated protein Csh1 [Euryarchaeota archaeon]